MKITNYTASECYIDREIDIEQIIDCLSKMKTSQVHIVFAKTGYGKTSFSKKLAQESYVLNWNIIRVNTLPRNSDSDISEGAYLNLIFNAISKYYKEAGNTDLFFEKYILSGKNKLIESLAADEAIEAFTSSDSKENLLFKMLGIQLKRTLKKGVFNAKSIIDDNSEISRSIKADYIRYIFEQTRTFLIIENIQNIDELSFKFLLDWINDTKDKKNVFILEYTISDSHGTEDMKSLQKSLSRTGTEVFECELEKMPPKHIAEVIDSQLKEHPSDIHFTINAIQHYEQYSNGNLWDLIDFARAYDDTVHSNELSTPTLLILNELSYEAQCLTSILACHSGMINKQLLNYMWLNYFSNKQQSDLDEVYCEMLDANIVQTQNTQQGEQIMIAHASILDVWQSNIPDFEAIDKEILKRLSCFYNENYCGKICAVNKEFAWKMLIRIYSLSQPDKITDLLNDFSLNLTKSISPTNIWSYLNLLIEHTKDNILKLQNVYFKILQICCNASLYEEGYYCITLMESVIDIDENKELLLNKILFLSILDKHDEVLELYKKALNKIEKYDQTWIKLNLLVLNSYIALGDRKSCQKIDTELIENHKFKFQPEYAFYLRLTNIYMRPSRALRNARKSAKIFHRQGDQKQEGKSLITYSKLLSSTGKHEKAIQVIKKAKDLLTDSNEGMSCIYNNLAGYLLLSGEHGSDVWNYLDIAEIYSVSTYDKLSVIINKLAWCYENNSFVRLDLLESKALEFIDLEPSKFIHCTAFYNLYITMKKAGIADKAEKYYSNAISLKDKCSYIRARIDGITWKTRYIKPRIEAPYHICYLSFWVFDL